MIAKHERAQQGQTVIWLTPPEILIPLGLFDLDPCAAPPPRPWLTATHHFDGSNYDGLKENWFGRVWLNPPYGNRIQTPWLEKMSIHKSGIALIFARTDTADWHDLIFPFAHSILFLRGRIRFRHPDGSAPQSEFGDGRSGAPSALISYSDFDTGMLMFSGLRGKLVPLSTQRHA